MIEPRVRRGVSALVEAVRLANGELQDDVAVLLYGSASELPKPS